MSTSPIVIISLAGQLSALEAKSFKSLNDDVQAAYGSFLKDSSSELVLTYHWQGVLLEVKSEQSLSTFLSLFQKGSVDKPARPVSAGRSRSVKTDAEGTLPLLELVQRKKIVAIPTVEELEAEFRASTGGSNATEESAPAASRGPRKAARQDTSPPPETIDTARPASAAGIYEDESPSASPEQNVWISGRGSTASRPNSATARELLASYRPPADPEPDSIRIVLRDGSSSVLMPYNSTYPPPLSEMRKFAWNFFKDRLEDRVAEIRGTPEGREAEQRLGKPIDAQKFLLGFWFEGCDLPIDMDDREDELLLKRAVEQFGLRDVIMYVDVPFVELQPVAMNPVTETVLPVSPRGLQVNLTRLPVRDKVRQTVRQQQLQLSQLREQIKAHKAETDGLNGSRK